MVDYDTSSLSKENFLPARVLQLRARIALGQAEEVLADVEGEGETPDLVAVKALANYSTGNIDGAIMEVEQLAAIDSQNDTVQVLGGTILQAAGKSDEALELLMKHQGSLEAYIHPLRLLATKRPVKTDISVISVLP